MRGTAIIRALSLVCAALLLAACDEEPTSPTALHDADGARAAHQVSNDVGGVLPDTFTFRAPFDPYFINQMPDLMLRSQVRTDLAVQRLVTPPGQGSWHTHPGPSFGLVQNGIVRITRYSPRAGCTTEEYGPGDTYYEVADEVHRADVMGTETAVEYKVRFHTPIGAPFGNPAADPGC